MAPSPPPPPLHTVLRRAFVIAILTSLIFLLAVAWIRGGVAATSCDTVDSRGRKMGFNDVFSSEHYGIVLRNAHVIEAIRQMDFQDWALAAAHGLLLTVTFSMPPQHLKYLLWLQPVIFFRGWFGLYMAPMLVADLLWFHTSDRETFIDVPWISLVGQGAWLWACLFMLWKLRKPRAVRAPAAQGLSAA